MGEVQYYYNLVKNLFKCPIYHIFPVDMFIPGIKVISESLKKTLHLGYDSDRTLGRFETNFLSKCGQTQMGFHVLGQNEFLCPIRNILGLKPLLEFALL